MPVVPWQTTMVPVTAQTYGAWEYFRPVSQRLRSAPTDGEAHTTRRFAQLRATPLRADALATP
jgi:hypothetical protein